MPINSSDTGNPCTFNQQWRVQKNQFRPTFPSLIRVEVAIRNDIRTLAALDSNDADDGLEGYVNRTRNRCRDFQFSPHVPGQPAGKSSN